MINEALHHGVILKDLLIDGTGFSISEAVDRLEITRTTLSRLLNQHATNINIIPLERNVV